MFTGLIQSVGDVKKITSIGGDKEFEFNSGLLDLSDLNIGDSIAVNGVCLTITGFNNDSFTADVSNETLSVTALKHITTGSKVNIEPALLPTTRLGGHFVSGHVDGFGQIKEITEDARSVKYIIQISETLTRYITPKGSICIDGVSLTVNAVKNDEFDVNIVPHTQKKTIISSYKIGQLVNIEVDLVMRYIESLINDKNSVISKETIVQDFLVKYGNVK